MKSLTRAFTVKRVTAAGDEAPIVKADRARDARNWTEAALAYAEAIETSPELASVWVQYGHALKEGLRRVEAEAAYRRALELQPNNADTHLQLGHLLKLEGRTDEAVSSYLDALELDDPSGDALLELESLANHGSKLPPARAMAVLGGPGRRLTRSSAELIDGSESLDEALRSAADRLSRLARAEALDARGIGALETALKALRTVLEPQPEKGDSAAGVLVFDIADLLAYFRNARLPTGIQRVQIEVVRGLAAASGPDLDVRVCGFVEGQDDWVEIPIGFFRQLCALSLSGGDVTDSKWLALMRQLDLLLLSSSPMDFPDGACLVNLGTSWWLQNYFLNIRRVKARHRITYVPFVHDLIPIMTPEHCVRELTQDFITWVLGVFQHADMFMVNSEATKRDLLAVAAKLGHTVAETDVNVVRLDADCRRSQAQADDKVLKQWGLKPGGYVLMVSTIESRKNHLGAFNAWISLIRKHGARAVPQLVCVGSAGWLNDGVHAKLGSSEVLRSRVKMLSRLPDGHLAALYQHCLFTLYPSHYEGWGLPITESLCHGKPVLASNASSLPEAGGEFADYFEAGSDSALAAAAEKLIFDAEHRGAREARIKAEFEPRSWLDIGREIGAAVTRLHAALHAEGGARKIRATDALPTALGVYYPLVRNFETRIWRGMMLGEMFRAGQGWWWPDDWGVWTKPGGGELAVRIEGPHRRLRVYLHIRGVLEHPSEWSLEVAAPSRRTLAGKLGPDEWRWQAIDLPASDTGTTLAATLAADRTQDLAPRTGGLDKRVTSIGLVGFYICEADNLADRLAFNEAVLFRDLDALTPGYEWR